MLIFLISANNKKKIYIYNIHIPSLSSLSLSSDLTTLTLHEASFLPALPSLGTDIDTGATTDIAYGSDTFITSLIDSRSIFCRGGKQICTSLGCVEDVCLTSLFCNCKKKQKKKDMSALIKGTNKSGAMRYRWIR